MMISRTQMMSEHQLILQAAGIGAWKFGIQEDVFDCDEICRSLLGLKEAAQDISLEQILERVHPDDREHARRVFSGEGLGLESVTLAFKTLDDGDGSKALQIKARHLPDLGGTPGRLMGVLIDETQNQRLKSSLEDTEQRFENLARSIPEVLLYIDPDLNITFANAAFSDVIQLPPEEIEGKNFERIAGERFAIHKDAIEKALNGERIVSERPGRVQNGEYRFRRYIYAPHHDKSGAVAGVLFLAADITERRQLQQAVEDKETKLKMLVDGFPSLFVYMDTSMNVEIVNDAFVEASGLPLEAIVGKDVRELLPAESFQRREPYFKRALAGEKVTFEDYGVDIGLKSAKDYFRYNYRAAYNNQGNVIGLLCEATNITELKKLELDLRRSNKDLEQFAYVASHDLKAPLRAIEVIVSWLKEDLADYHEGDVKENLDLLNQRTSRLAKLLDDLLAYSRAGRKVGQVAPLDTRALTQDVVNLLAPEDHVTVTLGDNLPELETYGAPLEQVLRNLISNAIKHHPGPAINIWVDCQEDEEFYIFQVRDNGNGIAPEYADRVFQMFQTLKPRDEVEGSGMGLAIVARIVEWQGGRVWFEEPDEGSGTVFKFQWKKQSPEANSQEKVA